jgi:hypothetical protein
MLSTELHGLNITCLSDEFAVFNPPAGQTCTAWYGDCLFFEGSFSLIMLYTGLRILSTLPVDILTIQMQQKLVGIANIRYAVVPNRSSA